MLVYEKKVDSVRHLFGNATGTIPTSDDVQLTYKDSEGNTLTLSESDTYLDNGHGGIISKSDGKDVNVFIGDIEIIGGEITPPPQATSIKVDTEPTKTSYSDGDKLDLTGLVVKVVFDDESEEAITDYTTTPADGAALTTTDTKVNIAWYELTTSFNITVS